MKLFLALAMSLVSSFAMADGLYKGLDQKGNPCQLTLEDVATVPTGVVETGLVDIWVGGYKLLNVNLDKKNESHYFVFRALLMDKGDNVYAQVIGSPITIGGIGLIFASVNLILDPASDSSVKVKLQGDGVWSWWKKDFTCNLVKVKK
jgi:hypothetical protein